MERLKVTFWTGLEPNSLTFQITETCTEDKILDILKNSDIEIITIERIQTIEF